MFLIWWLRYECRVLSWVRRLLFCLSEKLSDSFAYSRYKRHDQIFLCYINKWDVLFVYLVSPPDHKVGEYCNPGDGTQERDWEELLGWLEVEKDHQGIVAQSYHADEIWFSETSPTHRLSDIRQCYPQREDYRHDEEVSKALAVGFRPWQAQRLVLFLLIFSLKTNSRGVQKDRQEKNIGFKYRIFCTIWHT